MVEQISNSCCSAVRKEKYKILLYLFYIIIKIMTNNLSCNKYVGSNQKTLSPLKDLMGELAKPV